VVRPRRTVHFGQQWIGAAPQAAGLHDHNTSDSGIGLWAKNDEWGSGFSPVFGAAIFGDSTSDPGVAGFSNTGPGVYGWTSALNINAPAVVGENNSVTGSVVFGHAKAKTGDAAGVLGQSESTAGIGVKGVTTALVNANTVAGWFEAATGTGVFGRAQYGHAGLFSLTNLNNVSAALRAETYGKGGAASFQIINSDNTQEVLSAHGNGSGSTLRSVATGTGRAGYFLAVGPGKGVEVMAGNGVGVDVLSTGNHAISASASAENTVRAVNTGGKAAVSGNSPSGRGVEGLTTTGAAVHAYASNGTAVQARAPGGTALEIDGGALRVKGAGVNTGTAAFVHQCTAGNMPAAAGGNTMTIIDHPMCNNNPDAMLFVTPRVKFGNFTTTFTTFEDLAVSYNSGSGRWYIVNTSLLDELGDFDIGDQFNVMVVLP
jgi:hypothetical protein